MTHHMPAARAHRLADRHFFRAAARANQKEIDQIDRADEQEKKHAGLHQPEGRTDGAHVIRMEGKHRRAEASLGHHFRLRVVFLDRGVVRVDLRLCFGDRRARFQPRDHVSAATAGMALLPARAAQPGRLNGRKSRASEERNRKSGGNTPTIFRGMPFTRMSRPRTFGSELRRWRQKPSVTMTTACSQSPDVSASVKPRPITGPAPSVVKNSGETRMTSSCSVEPGSPTDFGAVEKDGKAREGRDVAAPLVVIGDRRAVVLDPGFRIGVEDRDQPVGLRKRKRPEQNGIDHREDREVRSEADRDRGQRRQRESRSLPEATNSVAHVIHHAVHSRTSFISHSRMALAS